MWRLVYRLRACGRRRAGARNAVCSLKAMSETSASKSAFDPEKFCECQKCFSIHRKGSTADELKARPAIVDAKTCKYCGGVGFVDVHDREGKKLGVKKCSHQPPQGDMPF
jgi:hypothetical protein